MFARSVTISQADLSALDKGVAYVREDVMPQLGVLGCLGISLVASRMARQVIVTSSWETREAMAPYRAQVAELLDGEVRIADWEVALMHRDHDAFDQAACRITWAKTPDVDSLLEVFRRWDQIREPGAYLRCAVISRCRTLLSRRRMIAQHPPEPAGLSQDAVDMWDMLAKLTDEQRIAVVLSATTAVTARPRSLTSPASPPPPCARTCDAGWPPSGRSSSHERSRRAPQP